MQPNPMVFRVVLRTLACFAFATWFTFSLAAQQSPRQPALQQSPVANRITQPIDESNLTTLKGNTHPLARPEFDQGPAPANLPLNRMLLVLTRSPEQEAALDALLDQQQDKASPNYHAWLTPEQFGQQFGPSDQDIQTVTSWLQSHGFAISHVSKGRTVIEFTGTHAQFQQTFHAEIHKYTVDGKERWANSRDPEIPSAFIPVVSGIVSLHNFPRKPLHRIVGVFSRAKDGRGYRPARSVSTASPLLTAGGGCGLLSTVCYAVGPYDFATIYNILPLWNASSPIDGTGQSIAIVGQSDVYPQDFSNFRSDFGLPAGNLNIIHDGPDPGKLATQGDETESDLDVQWSGALAKGATIDFVVSASTNSSAGVDLSAEYIVDNNIAPVMSESYGACELDMGTAGNQFYNQVWQQAAAEGITVFVSAGDSGSAVCDRGSSLATHGLSVNGISSTPYDVAVGGTDFNDLSDPGTYWSSTNNSVTEASAISYIPEMTWNDTCTNIEFFQFTGSTTEESDCNDSSSLYWPSFLVPVGGSGGASNCTTSANQSLSSCGGGYAKPSWQTGAGVPNDGKRDVPDISMFAGDGLNASFYVVCETDIYGGCAGDIYSLVGIGGTSAPTPALAGIMALVNQKMQSRQGNVNYVFYPLAAQPGASCNSAGTVGSSCIFYDTTTGTNAMPCVTGSPNCVTNVSGDQNGVLSGYGTTTGYDLATGLGSVNVANLVNKWNSVSFQPTVSTLSLSPTTQIIHGSPVNLTVAVTPKTGTGTPSGLVSLLTSTGPAAGTFALANGSVSATTGLLPGGSYTVSAHYAGDGTYAASDSTPGVPVTVSAEPSITTVQAYTVDQNGNEIPFTTGPYGGNTVYLRTNVAGKSGKGVATGTVNLTQTVSGTISGLPGGTALALNSEGCAVLVGYSISPYPFLSPATYSIGANYSGDASFDPGTSTPVTLTITPAQTTASTSYSGCIPGYTPCTVLAGTQLTVFGTVPGALSGFAILPTGTMTFYSNGTMLGPPVPLDSNIVPPIASISINLPVGQNNVTAQYSGDVNYAGSVSQANVVNVATSVPVSTFAITANPMVIGVASPGQSGSTTLTFAAQNGFTGSATLTSAMCVGLPSESTCSFSPSSVNLTAQATPQPVTLTINTTAPSSAAPSSRRFTPSNWRVPSELGLLCALCIALVLLTLRPSHRPATTVLVLALLAAMATATSCGGGSSGSTGPPPPPPNLGTPTGNYTITVTVTMGGVTQSINNIALNVQ